VAFAWNIAEAQGHREDGCEALVWRPATGLLVTRVSGHATLAALGFYAMHAEREMRSGKIATFHDWSNMTGYEPAARDEIKRWGKAHNGDFVGVHYLVRSKVIAMLISVAAFTLGRDLFATTDRPAFLAALEAALAHR